MSYSIPRSRTEVLTGNGECLRPAPVCICRVHACTVHSMVHRRIPTSLREMPLFLSSTYGDRPTFSRWDELHR